MKAVERWMIFALALGCAVAPFAPRRAEAAYVYTWTTQASGTVNQLNSVSAVSANDVWAVGESGTILRYNGSQWQAMTSPVSASFTGVFALDANNVWAVGQGGTIVYYDGAAWHNQSVGAPYPTLNDVCAYRDDEAWAVGEGGAIYAYDGTTWTPENSWTAVNLYGVSVDDNGVCWAVGASTICSNHGLVDGWTNWPSPVTAFLNAVEAISGGNVWIVGSEGTALHCQASNTYVLHVDSVDLQGVSAASWNDIWAVGRRAIFYCNGSSWADQSYISDNDLLDVAATDMEHIWAVGANGAIVFGQGRIPQAEMVLNGSTFNAGSTFTATFKLNESITRQFIAYAVIFMPGGGMINARPLNGPLKPIGSAPGLQAPFETLLIYLPSVPPTAPKGDYEIVAAFFDPAQPIHGRQDAFLEASATFTVQ